MAATPETPGHINMKTKVSEVTSRTLPPNIKMGGVGFRIGLRTPFLQTIMLDQHGMLQAPGPPLKITINFARHIIIKYAAASCAPRVRMGP